MIINKQEVLGAVVVMFLVVLSGCWNKDDVNPTEKNKALLFNFDTLQAKAASFRPVPGKRGGTLRLPRYNEPESFNPITNLHAVPHMFEGLVRIDGITGDPVPGLCEKWEVSENQLTWKFYIRKNVLWSDSVQFTAYDVEFTFNKLIYDKKIKPNIARSIFTYAGKKIDVQVVDSFCVQFVLPIKDFSFIRYMSQEILPKHICESVVKKGGFSDYPGLASDLTQMAGTGPFLISSYASYNSIVFVRNPLYWKTDETGLRLPYLDSIVYVLVSDIDEAIGCFKNGEIDYMSLSGNEFKELTVSDSAYSTIYLGPALGCNALAVNQNVGVDAVSGGAFVNSFKQKWFSNKNFRKALSFAINRRNLIDSIFFKKGYIQKSPLSRGCGDFYYNDCLDYSLDIKKAKSLLAEEGFGDSNGDGVLEDKDSNPVQLSLYVNNGNSSRKKMAELIIKDFDKLGIKIDLHSIDNKIFEQKLFSSPYDWDLALVGFAGGKDPMAAKDIWHSEGKYHIWNFASKTKSPWQISVDSLFDEASKEPDVKKRKLFFSLWQKIVSDELPLIFTVQSERILVVSNKIGNVNPTIYGGLLHNIEQLYEVK